MVSAYLRERIQRTRRGLYLLLALATLRSAAVKATFPPPAGAVETCGAPRVVVAAGISLPSRNVTLVAQDKSKGVTWFVSLAQRRSSAPQGSGSRAAGSRDGVGAGSNTWAGDSNGVHWTARAVLLPFAAGNHETAVSPDGERPGACAARSRVLHTCMSQAHVLPAGAPHTVAQSNTEHHRAWPPTPVPRSRQHPGRAHLRVCHPKCNRGWWRARQRSRAPGCGNLHTARRTATAATAQVQAPRLCVDPRRRPACYRATSQQGVPLFRQPTQGRDSCRSATAAVPASG